MEYRKHIETKIIRTEHHVVVWPGGSVLGLLKALKNVPIDAKLEDIEDGPGSRVKLIFRTESAVEPAQSAAKEPSE